MSFLLDKTATALAAAILCLAPSMSSGSGPDVSERLERWIESCPILDYRSPVGSVARSILRIDVAFDEDYFDEEPPAESGTAFLVDRQNGLLLTALHTLFPGAGLASDDCNTAAPKSEYLTITTSVYHPSGTPLTDVPLSVVENGWDGCTDSVLLRIDPDLVGNAMPLQMSREVPPNEEQVKLFDVHVSPVPASSYAPSNLHIAPAPPMTDAKMCKGWIPECCESGGCRSVGGKVANGGLSGSPLVDDSNRFVGIVMRRFDNSVDTSWVLPPRAVEGLLLRATSLEEAQFREVIRWIQGGSYSQLANADALSNLEFIHFLNRLHDRQDLEGLKPQHAICPLAQAVEVRRLGRKYQRRLENLGLAQLARSEDPTKSTRVHMREIAQGFSRIAFNEQTGGDRARSIKAHAMAGDAYALAIGMFLRENDASPYVASLVRAMPDVPQPEVTNYAARFAAIVGTPDWNLNAEPEGNRVLASMLREYADTNAALARLNVEDAVDRAALASNAAYWSATLSDRDADRARAFRTLGDSYVAGNDPALASGAYATAIIEANHDNNETLTNGTLLRLIETAELANLPVSDSGIRQLKAAGTAPQELSKLLGKPIRPAPKAAVRALELHSPYANVGASLGLR